MKKLYFIAIALFVVMMAAVSCSNSPKSKGENPAAETPGDAPPLAQEAPPPEPAEDFAPEAVWLTGIPFANTDEIASIDEDIDWEDIAEDVLPEADEEFLAEDELLAGEPEDLAAVEEEPEPPIEVVIAAPEPEPTPPPPPPPAVTPPTVTARPQTPPPATARPTTTPASTSPATTTPATTTPATPWQAAPNPAAATPAAVTPPITPFPFAREDLPDAPEVANPTTAFRGRPEDETVFSRTVRATVGQLVVVPFRGTGWVYLGEAGAKRGIVYDSRRLDPEGQSFMFRTEAAGEYALKFYRQDFIRDFILNDYVRVIVGEPPETAGAGWFNPPVDRGRVVAEPRWPSSLEEAQALRSGSQPSQRDLTLSAQTTPAQTPATQTPPTASSASPATAQTPTAQSAAQTPPASPATAQTPAASTPAAPPAFSAPALSGQSEQPPVFEPDEYIQKAREEFDAGRVAEAIASLDRLRAYYPMESDEVLWLYGQFYEANSPSRNILTALDCYQRLMREYPQSSRFDAARRRAAYLQRYYINIQ